MDAEKLISGRRILIVDDEEDVLEQLIELLDMCKIDTASTFEEGKARLEDEVVTYWISWGSEALTCWRLQRRKRSLPSC
jgi:DNA-binding response OmpR family regulator